MEIFKYTQEQDSIINAHKSNTQLQLLGYGQYCLIDTPL